MGTDSNQRTVLIANPCDAERALLACALQSHGFSSCQAACAKEAIEAARNQAIDLIVLDSLNWETPTLAALSVLKHDAQTCRIPVIVFGQPQRKEQVLEAVQKGAVTWIGRKGFALSRFIEKITAIIDHSDQQSHETCPPDLLTGLATTSQLEKITLPAIEEMLSQSEALPAFEFTLVNALTTTASKERTAEHIGEMVGRDPILSLAVLSASNARDGESQPPVQDVQQAVGLVGAKEFYRLIERVPALAVNLASLWDAGCFWAHSVATARIAGMLSRRLDLGVPAVAETAGLLHDLGRFILATRYPKHYGALFSAATAAESIHPLWEREIIGAHHGEIGAWAMRHFRLALALQDVAEGHHIAGRLGQSMSASSRLLTMVVHAADGLADALFPADPPLTALDNPSDEFDQVLRRSEIAPRILIDESRKIVAGLLTEMAYLFPQSVTRSFFHRQEPLARVGYFAPAGRALDVFRVALETRSEELLVLDRLTNRALPAGGIPLVVNLTSLPEPAAQIEVLTSLMAAHISDKGPGLVLLPTAIPHRLAQDLVGPSWRMVCLPVHFWKCLRGLASGVSDELASNLRVA